MVHLPGRTAVKQSSEAAGSSESLWCFTICVRKILYIQTFCENWTSLLTLFCSCLYLLIFAQGSFDQKVCRSLHSINPYSSRESRIIFSTWNLDHRLDDCGFWFWCVPNLSDIWSSSWSILTHAFKFYDVIHRLVFRIEKKRTIIPALLEALQNHQSSDINVDYFYQLLFTRENLKLVHIVCHKKGAHNLLCDSKKMFQAATKTNKAKVKKRRLMWKAVFCFSFMKHLYPGVGAVKWLNLEIQTNKIACWEKLYFYLTALKTSLKTMNVYFGYLALRCKTEEWLWIMFNKRQSCIPFKNMKAFCINKLIKIYRICLDNQIYTKFHNRCEKLKCNNLNWFEYIFNVDHTDKTINT